MKNKKPSIPTQPAKMEYGRFKDGYQPNKNQKAPSSPNLPSSGSSTTQRITRSVANNA